MTLFDTYKPSELGYQLYQDFTDAFQKHAWNNAFVAGASFHLLLGQMPNVRKLKILRSKHTFIDARVHVCYLSPSGTGKGVVANYNGRMATSLGLKFQKMDKITDSGLVGSVDPKTKEPQLGWLHPKWGINILASTEASMILTDRPTPWAQDAMKILQEAMNPIGTFDATVAKKVGFGDVMEVQPDLSLFLASYIPPALTNIVIESGFLQRMYLVVNFVDADDRHENVEIGFSKMENPEDTTEIDDSIVKRMKYVNDQLNGLDHMPISKEAIAVFRKSAKELFDQLQDTEPFLKNKLGEFVTRFIDLLTKVSVHFEIIKGGKIVSEESAEQAAIHMLYIFQDLISFLERTIVVPQAYLNKFFEMKQRTFTAYEMLCKHDRYQGASGWVQRTHLAKAIRHLHGVTELTANEYVERCLEAKLLVDKEDKVKWK